MGRVAVCGREGIALPPDCAVDAKGNVTTNPSEVAALLPFGKHKGYGLALIDELYAGLIGGGPPPLRHRAVVEGEKQCCTFYFQATHPDALDCGRHGHGRTQAANIKTVRHDACSLLLLADNRVR
jgi:ureidoglycolate dehydrogenase (NAD+)